MNYDAQTDTSYHDLEKQGFKEIEKLCEELEEFSYYVVWVSLYPGNLVHKAIMHTGSRDGGGYRHIWNSSYEMAYEHMHRVKGKVISKIEDMKIEVYSAR